MTVRRCTPVGNKGGLDLGMYSEDQGFSWIEHFQRLKEAHALGVPAPNVETRVDRDGKT